MSIHSATLENFIRELHTLSFFKEFTFASNRFSPTPNDELELADNIIRLADDLMIFQLKERSAEHAGNETSETKWFERKVVRAGTKQIRDTLRYLNSFPGITLTNERGHSFNIAEHTRGKIRSVIIYLPASNLAETCINRKFYVSREAGFIHLIDASDYLLINRSLQIPRDIISYLDHRAVLLKRYSQPDYHITESMMLGHYIGESVVNPPSERCVEHLQHLVQDTENWDLSSLIGKMHDSIQKQATNTDYYSILEEIMRLPRSGWREVKKRLQICLEVCKERRLERPYRFVNANTGCGFLFIPVFPEVWTLPNAAQIRVNGLKNLTFAHMYDQKVERCVGVSFSMDGEFFEIDWCYMNSPWVYDREMETRLQANFPFRGVRAEIKPRFYVAENAS